MFVGSVYYIFEIGFSNLTNYFIKKREISRNMWVENQIFIIYNRYRGKIGDFKQTYLLKKL